MIFEVTGDRSERPVFPCDVLRPAKSASGSLILEFRNMAGDRIKEALRLFAAGEPSVSRSITIDLPPLPLIITLIANGKKYVTSSGGTPLQIVPGRKVQIGGLAFLLHQTLWIGSNSFPVKCADSQSIDFEVPKLSEGQYPLFIENEHGTSNAVAVQVAK